MLFEEYLLLTRKKAMRCRDLFAKIVSRYDGKLSPAAFEKANWILWFLEQSEHSYVLREYNLKKLAEESDER